jgi:hypothetical protein
MKSLAVCAAILGLALLPAGAVHAQKKMYKCGSQFQDRPCDGGPAAPAAAPKPAAPAPTATKASASAEEGRRQIRCDNMGRQVLDLRQREQKEQNVEAAKNYAAQRSVVESRMKTDKCDPL